MMGYGGWVVFGMHAFWWLFWVLLIALLFGLFGPVPRKKARTMRGKPLDLLQRRYAAGEISTAEYEERKATLERDQAAR